MKCLRGMLLLRTAAEAPTINAPIVEVVLKAQKLTPLEMMIRQALKSLQLALFKFLGTYFFR